MATIDIANEARKARTLRQRFDLDRIDYQRELVRLSSLMTQRELSAQLGVSQPTITSTLRTAAKVPKPRPGFSGASPYEIAQRYATGELTRAQLVDELTRWQYPPQDVTDGYDSLLVPVAGSWDDVERALRHRLLDGAIYDEILDGRARAAS